MGVEGATGIVLHLLFFSLKKLMGPTWISIYLWKVNRIASRSDRFLLSCSHHWSLYGKSSGHSTTIQPALYNQKHALVAFRTGAATSLWASCKPLLLRKMTAVELPPSLPRPSIQDNSKNSISLTFLQGLNPRIKIFYLASMLLLLSDWPAVPETVPMNSS